MTGFYPINQRVGIYAAFSYFAITILKDEINILPPLGNTME